MSFDAAELTRALRGLGISESVSISALFHELGAAYGAPERRYHDSRHVAACLRAFASLRDLAERPHEIEVALWFHDAIYDTRRNDNEARSAAWAESFLTAAGVELDAVQRIAAMIVATKTHRAPFPDAALLIDVDLGILGAPLHVFDRYDRAIREEYHWVPEAQYRAGRVRILRGFAERPEIYVTPALRDRLERQARTNLARKIEQLAGD